MTLLFLCIVGSLLCHLSMSLQISRFPSRMPFQHLPWDRVRTDETVTKKNPLKVEIVSSAILSFAPWLELHHIVVLKDPSVEHKGVYTVDFSPSQYDNPKTLAMLLLGRSVPGEIRVRWIPAEKVNLSEIKENCMSADGSFFQRHKRMGLNLQNSSSKHVPRSPAVEAFLDDLKSSWQEQANLYLRNCQHFAYYAYRRAHKEFNVVKGK